MKNGVLNKAELNIVEAPRYFEAMLKGRNFHEVAITTSRICGICSLGHQMTSLKATETALGLEISKQTEILISFLLWQMILIIATLDVMEEKSKHHYR